MKLPRTIILSRPDALGDAVVTLPMAGLLKRIAPDTRIIALVKQYTLPVWQHCAHVDVIITLEELQADLAHCNGTEYYYPSLMRNVVYTDGMKRVADLAGAYWLIDYVAPLVSKMYPRAGFQLWELEVTGSEAVLTMREDSDRPALHEERIPYTDFPEGRFKFYACGTPARFVIMVPEEY